MTQEKNLPLTIGILLDTSGSQTNVLPLEQDSGARFLREVLTPKDEAFLISFDVNVDLLSDFTNSPRELARAIQKASINAGELIRRRSRHRRRSVPGQRPARNAALRRRVSRRA